MRLPFDFGDQKLHESARVKFLFTSPELHQNIEISLDGDETSVETLLDAFHRFLGALGIVTPENVVLTFVEIEDEQEDDTKSDDDEDSSGPNNKKRKGK